MITFSDLVLYFMLYSFLGWICEVVYCSILAKQFVNRGFLSGPFLPIYGFGAIIILIMLKPLTGNPLLFFVATMVATTILEYVTSWAMEELFGLRWWDYSHEKFNINGRVCLKTSLLFGTLGMIVAYLIHPTTTKIVMGMSVQAKQVIAGIFLFTIIVDLIITIVNLIKLNKRIDKINELLKSAQMYNVEYTWFDRADINGSFVRLEEICIKTEDPALIDTTNQIRELTMKENPGKRFLAAFPNLKHPAFEQKLSEFMMKVKDKNAEILENLKKSPKQHIEEKEAEKKNSDKK